MIVFLLLYSSNFPQITPSGLVCKKLKLTYDKIIMANYKK